MKTGSMTGRASRLWVVCAAIVGTIVGTFAMASQADAQGRPLLLVPFERDNIDDIFYSTLMQRSRESAAGAREYQALDPIETGLQELLTQFGCEEASPECLQQVAEIFGAEVILYGKVWGNERGIYLEVNLFDAQLGEEIIEDPIKKGFESADKEQLLQMAVGELQQVFYPFTGELTVASTEPATQIIFDGAEVGNTTDGPIKLTGRRLGEHIVTARKGDDEVTQTIVLLHDTPMSITLDPTADDGGGGGGGGGGGEGYAHWGSTIVGAVGVASLATGAIFSVMVDGQNSEVEDIAKRDQIDPGEADDALNSGKQLEALQFVFYGIGAAAIGTAAVLYFTEGGEESEGASTISPLITGDGGIGVSVGGSF